MTKFKEYFKIICLMFVCFLMAVVYIIITASLGKYGVPFIIAIVMAVISMAMIIGEIAVMFYSINKHKKLTTILEETEPPFTLQDAISEAQKCLSCKNPRCVEACPLGNDIPTILSLVKEEKLDKAMEVLYKTTCLPSVCGRVCPHEKQCQGACVKGIKSTPVRFGKVEAFLADNQGEKSQLYSTRLPQNGQKVAVIGSGPASLSCAINCAQKGFSVTVFEREELFGGILTYGIPRFVLPEKSVSDVVKRAMSLGVEFASNTALGKDITFNSLYEMGYRAIFLGVGANEPYKMEIEGEDLQGVYSANEYLKPAHKPLKTIPQSLQGKKVVVIGGGNVAVDAGRLAKRFARDVSIVYRRSDVEMPARKAEIEKAKAEGIKIMFLTAPIKIIGKKGKVRGIECIKTQLSEPDSSGRRRPVNIEGSQFIIPADTIVSAVGSHTGVDVSGFDDELQLSPKGLIVVDENNMTSLAGVLRAEI